ncbi:hypothetical protein A1O1_03635 [Capronia coronata CBS 617.96]|uniref:BTB domain-containing protein n=1 Tax=Capronia coronata CBS 617.96 TaxID=1182541 RepID=W9YCC9_9EURO|nr:uncharacterized protein A1O1_03635 [Capronia coronata CBS 617.96]EXJ90532.1 hypothetical protein A1O1_03635 [Capronia coronata CBS 617.96]
MVGLRELLTTAEGCDLIIVCQGEFFFVHKAVIGPQSTVLKTETSNSQFLNGEAYIVADISAMVFRKVLTFLYRGDTSDFPPLHQTAFKCVPPTLEYFANTFPNTDKFLTTVVGKPVPKSSVSIPSAGPDMIGNRDKWAVLIGKQRVMGNLYEEKTCTNLAEVSKEMDIFAAAQQLDMAALKELAMKKVFAWFEKELRLGTPLSEELNKVAELVLRKEKSFVKPFFRLYAKFFPTVGMNLTFSRLMRELDRDTFDMLAELHSQWTTERSRLDEALEQTTRKAADLEVEVNLLKAQKASSETQQKDLENLKEALKISQAKEIVSATKAELFENLNKTLQMDLLMTRVSNLHSNENHPPRADPRPKKDTATEDAEKLKRQITDTQQALQQHKAGHKKVKNDLKREKQLLKEQLDDLKDAFKMFMDDVNKSGRCAGCKRQWNFTIDQDHYDSIKIACKLCHEEVWYYEDR